jgi:photosystem II stability/assembly factor-like uncharacterized protein
LFMYKMANKFIQSDTSLACLSVAVSGVKAIAIGVRHDGTPVDSVVRIHYSTNGGQTWNPSIIKSFTGAPVIAAGLNWVVVVMDTVIAKNVTYEYAIAVCDNKINSSKIYYSTDGGKTWTISTSSFGTFIIKSIAIIGPKAFAVCVDATSSKIYYSADGGATWKSEAAPKGPLPYPLVSVAMNDVIASAVGGSKILMSSNKTRNKWANVVIDDVTTAANFTSVAINGPDVVAVGSESGSAKICHSGDSGVNWTSADSLGDGVFNSVAMCGSNAIAVGGTSDTAKICHSGDRGVNWTSIGSLGDGVFNSVVMCGGKALAVGRTTEGDTRIMSSDNNGTSWYNALASMSDGISPGIFKAAMSTRCTILAGYGTGEDGSKIALPIYYYSTPATAANT